MKKEMDKAIKDLYNRTLLGELIWEEDWDPQYFYYRFKLQYNGINFLLVNDTRLECRLVDDTRLKCRFYVDGRYKLLCISSKNNNFISALWNQLERKRREKEEETARKKKEEEYNAFLTLFNRNHEEK